MVNAEVEVYYKENYYETEDGVRYPKETIIIKQVTTSPITDKRKK